MSRTSTEDVRRMGEYLARRVLKTGERKRRSELAGLASALPIGDRVPTLIAACLALAEIIDGCAEVSPVAREHVRGRVQPDIDPFHAAMRGGA